MKVDIIISADDIKDEKIEGKTVVVIDMLRATSVIVTALNNGCKGVIPVTTVDEAKEIANKNREDYVLGGERNALKIKGFDFSNSPLEYKKEIAENKILIMTTSNGTRAIKGSEKAKNIFIGALINTKAVSQKIIELNDDVVFINSGTDGQFSMDDFICAGYMIYCVSKNKKVELSDISKTALYIYENNKDIFSFIENAKHYKRMKDLALYDDLEYCCQKDIINIVPEYKDGIIK